MSERTETLDLTAPARALVIELPAGECRIEPGEADLVTVTLAGRDADLVEVEAAGGTVSVRLPRDGRFSRSSVALSVAVPPGLDLTVRSASMDVAAAVALGDVDVRTASGDVRLSDVASLSVKAASGDVRVERVAGDLTAALASGDVAATSVGGDVTTSTASGDVRVDHASGRLELRTASGEVLVGRWEGTDAALKTVSGHVRLTVPAGTRGDLDLTSFSGRVRLPSGPTSDVPDAERVRRRIRFRSVSGDFDLHVDG
ncbi:MAG: DUF4097 family beta strand repeat-containing protein [Acidimicrobiia bacterium]